MSSQPPGSGGGSASKTGPVWIPDLPKSRGQGFSSLAQVMVSAQARLAQLSQAPMTQSTWANIAGERIAQRSRVGSLRKGVLELKVASSAWAQELSFLKPDLLQKLRRAGFELQDLWIRVDGLQARSWNSGRKSLPAGPQSARFEERVQVELSPEFLQRLEAVEDPNLRAAIFEAARYSLERQAQSAPEPKTQGSSSRQGDGSRPPKARR